MSGSHLPLMEEGMARWPFGPPNAGIALDFVGAPPALDELRALVEERWKALPRLTQILVAPGAASRTGLAWWTGRHRWASRDGHDLAQQVDSADATLRDAVRQWFHTRSPPSARRGACTSCGARRRGSSPSSSGCTTACSTAAP